MHLNRDRGPCDECYLGGSVGGYLGDLLGAPGGSVRGTWGICWGHLGDLLGAPGGSVRGTWGIC